MIRNLRDLSIYKNNDGKHLKEKAFIRSSALINLEMKDVEYLSKLHPVEVVDLRSDTEIAEKPDFMLDKYHHISILKDMNAGISHDKESDEKLEAMVPDMCELYTDFIRDDYEVARIADALRIICDPDRDSNIIWHCTEGKDRCGIVSALFLKFMGFDDSIVYKDYLKSSKSANKKAMKLFLMIVIFRHNLRLAKSVKKAYSVKEEYLKSAFDELINKYGSFEDFFANIGLGIEVANKMKEKYFV